MATGTIPNEEGYTVLYDTNFQTGQVTLKESIANFKYIEITFGNVVYRVENNFSSTYSLTLCSYGIDTSSSNPGLIMSFIGMSFSGTTANVTTHWRQFSYKNSPTPVIDNTLYNYVQQIRGYR